MMKYMGMETTSLQVVKSMKENFIMGKKKVLAF